MEFKVLFYILAVVAWLAMKFFEKQKSFLKKFQQTIDPPAPVTIPNVAGKKVMRNTPSKLPVIKKRTERAERVKTNVVIPENLDQKFPTSPTLVTELETLSKSTSIQYEIRSGSVDWRKAFILSEILRPV